MRADMQVRPRPPVQRHDVELHDVVLDEPAAEAASVLFRLLSDPTRLSVVFHLCQGERSVNELAALVDRPSPAVSQHLAKLRLARLVSTRREGTTVFYRLDTVHVGRLVIDALSHTQHAEEPR